MQLRLKTPADVRRSLQKVGNLVLDGKVDPKAANCFVACANVILQSLRVDEQEQRLRELEEIVRKFEEGE